MPCETHGPLHMVAEEMRTTLQLAAREDEFGRHLNVGRHPLDVAALNDEEEGRS